MQVILTQDVKGLGKKNQMVKASDGYARNFLLPKGLAVEATNTHVNIMQGKQDAERSKAQKEREHALAQAKAIEAVTVTVKVKCGENGKLFGSLTAKEVADSLRAQHNIDIEKKKIEIKEPIKALGKYTFDVKLYPQIGTRLNVVVEGV